MCRGWYAVLQVRVWKHMTHPGSARTHRSAHGPMLVTILPVALPTARMLRPSTDDRNSHGYVAKKTAMG
jgi:hypothetical protein